uniref:KpsF/GutQ family sugar-phosphate isomerase n=1 Tax=Flavobacterium sp. TaxID=239 RepID=UPI0040499925
MISKEKIVALAKNTIIEESKAVAKIADLIDVQFVESVELIYNCIGRLVITGIGKSAIIAQKIVATLNSTGTPSVFLHASEAIHGDLGMVQPNDVIICISKSGNSPEIKVLIPILKNFGNPIIAITGNLSSFLAKNAQHVLDTTVEKEACPNNLAPTSSTTAQLVMGDALAVCLMEMRAFKSQDFAKYHPGGALGKKLLLKVKDLLDEDKKPLVNSRDDIKKVIVEISEKRLGVTAVADDSGKIIGIITDGDIRRMLYKNDTFLNLKANDIMTVNPKKINSNDMVIDAFSVMESFSITQLLVLDNDAYVGIIHLHDILKEGIS